MSGCNDSDVMPLRKVFEAERRRNHSKTLPLSAQLTDLDAPKRPYQRKLHCFRFIGVTEFV